MASPFSIFRKRQKVMIAALGVLTMFAFVFIPIIMQGMGGQAHTNPVVIKTSKFGNLLESDLARLREKRQKVRMVFTELGQKAGANPVELDRIVDARIGLATEEAVAETWLKARYAEQLGMVINDETVNGFIEHWTGNRVKAEDILAAFQAHPSRVANPVLRDDA